MTWPDIERELALWADSQPEVSHADTVTPDPTRFTALLEAGFVVRVGKLGGTDDGLTDFPRVDIDVFGKKRNATMDFARLFQSRLRPRTRLASAIIDTVRANPSPRQVPWSNDNTIRISATYSLGLRR